MQHFICASDMHPTTGTATLAPATIGDRESHSTAMGKSEVVVPLRQLGDPIATMVRASPAISTEPDRGWLCRSTTEGSSTVSRDHAARRALRTWCDYANANCAQQKAPPDDQSSGVLAEQARTAPGAAFTRRACQAVTRTIVMERASRHRPSPILPRTPARRRRRHPWRQRWRAFATI